MLYNSTAMVSEFDKLLYAINKEVLNPAITLLFLCAIVVFFYGLFKFISRLSSPQEREIGRRVMVWGIVGMFIMVSAFAIIRVALSLAGVMGPLKLPF